MAGTLFQDNLSPYLTLVEGSAPSAPAAGDRRIYVLSSDHLVYLKDSSSAVVALMSNPMTTAGDTMYGGASGLPTRLAGGTSGYVLTSNGATSAPSWQAAAGGSSGLLAVHAYGPASAAIYTTTSTSMADVDATNMAVTFTAPASGNVLVRLSAWADVTPTNQDEYWGLRESTTNLTGSMGIIMRAQNPAPQAFVTYTVYLTGVSGGSHTYKWSFGTSAGGGTARIVAGDGSAIAKFAPAIMEVWAAP